MRNIRLEGATTVEGSIDYGMKLSGLKEAIGDKRIRRILESVGKVLGEGMLPIKVRGTISEPKLALEPSLGGLKLGDIDLGSIDLEGLDLEGLDLEGILKGRIPRPGASQ